MPRWPAPVQSMCGVCGGMSTPKSLGGQYVRAIPYSRLSGISGERPEVRFRLLAASIFIKTLRRKCVMHTVSASFFMFCTDDDCLRATGNSVWNDPEDCLSSRSGVLRRQQRSVCSRHVDLMEFVSQAARIAVDLCQQLFAERRWNCSSIQRAPKFRRDLTSGIHQKCFVCG